jgi:hypothetical protein
MMHWLPFVLLVSVSAPDAGPRSPHEAARVTPAQEKPSPPIVLITQSAAGVSPTAERAFVQELLLRGASVIESRTLKLPGCGPDTACIAKATHALLVTVRAEAGALVAADATGRVVRVEATEPAQAARALATAYLHAVETPVKKTKSAPPPPSPSRASRPAAPDAP